MNSRRLILARHPVHFIHQTTLRIKPHGIPFSQHGYRQSRPFQAGFPVLAVAVFRMSERRCGGFKCNLQAVTAPQNRAQLRRQLRKLP
jgi:hypothetical protein